MNIGKLFKVIVYVRDMHAMVQFYRDTLALELAYPAGLDDYSSEMWVAFNAGGSTFALHGGGSGQVAAGAPRYGFDTTDIEAAREALLAGGVQVSEVRQPVPGTQVVDCQDPEGNGFFLEQQG